MVGWWLAIPPLCVFGWGLRVKRCGVFTTPQRAERNRVVMLEKPYKEVHEDG